MRLRLPFSGTFAVTQRFGMRPEVYGKWGLPGHEGIDFGLPRGTPVLAVDDGTVNMLKTVGNYGNHVRIVHSWGESVYAHLDRFTVASGSDVKAGDMVGLSGNTGNTEGPHLHFGMRVAPFFRDGKFDPYQGFCNPWEYFQPYRNPIGPHIVNGNGAMLPVLQRWQPAVVTVLDPDAGFVAEMKRQCAQTLVVGRIYRPDSEVAERVKRDPGEAAVWMDGMVRSQAAYGEVDVWQVANEVCQGEWEAFTRLNACMKRWMEMAGKDYRCGLFAFGVGNPEAPVNDAAWWRELRPTLQTAAAGDHVLLLHEYGCKPGLDGPLDQNGKPTTAWRAQRYVNQVRPYGYAPRTLKVVISEFGYDGLLMGSAPSGWQESGLSAEAYAKLLLEFGEHYGRYRDQVLGVCVYTWGHNAPWGTYDIAGEVAERLAGGGEQGELTTEDAENAERKGEGRQEQVDEAALAAGRGLKRLSLNATAALQRAIVKAGYAVTSDEFGFACGEGRYVGQWGERTDGKAMATVFYCPVGRWDEVRQVAEASR